MIITISSKLDAARHWYKTMTAYKSDIIEALLREDFDSWVELTPWKVGDTVTYSCEEYEVQEILEDGKVRIKNDDEEETVESSWIEPRDYDGVPMWGYLWELDSMDLDWVRENLSKVAECGFKIYEIEKFDLLLIGIDGAGYDFYEEHWIPLYEARGLQWHDEK